MSAGFVLDDVVTVLGADDAEGVAGLPTSRALALYRQMELLRAVDARAESLREQGRLGEVSRCHGAEAIVVGTLAALGERDWIFPDASTSVAAVLRGMSLRRWFDHLYGNASDPTRGKSVPGHLSARAHRVACVAGRLGMQLTESVGFAWASRAKGDAEVTVAFLDESETAAGDFHNGLNFAGVYRAPVVFVCRSREGSPAVVHGAAPTVAQRAFAYGVTPARVDGDDLFAVVLVLREAVERARKGEGPTFIEAICAAGAAVDPKSLESALRGQKSRDPIARVRVHLEAEGALRASEEGRWKTELDALIAQAIEQAEATRKPDVRTLFEDVFEAPSWNLREQRKTLGEGT